MDISVIIPIYNVEKYLEQCLESVLNQTFINYEIICIDDASTDQSEKIIKKYLKKHSKIRFFKHDKNQGLSMARNTGLKNAKGKYILFVDSDDLIIPETLKELFTIAEENVLDIIYFNMKKIYESNMEHMKDTRETIFKEYEKVYSGQQMFAMFSKEKQLKIEVWRQFYKKNFLLNNNICFKKDILHEDDIFSFLCAMKANRVMNINKNYYIYRQHEGSIMTTVNEKRLKSLFIIAIEIFQYWNLHEFSEEVNCAIAYFFELIYSSFITYKNNFDNYEDLNFGSYAENKLYSLLMKGITRHYAYLSNDKINMLRGAEQIIIFGAGYAAHEIIEILHSKKIEVNMIAVSNSNVTTKTFYGIEVRNIDELLEYRKTAVVIIGVTNKYFKEVQLKLASLGFENLMIIDEYER